MAPRAAWICLSTVVPAKYYKICTTGLQNCMLYPCPRFNEVKIGVYLFLLFRLTVPPPVDGIMSALCLLQYSLDQFISYLILDINNFWDFLIFNLTLSCFDMKLKISDVSQFYG